MLLGNCLHIREHLSILTYVSFNDGIEIEMMLVVKQNLT